MWLTDKLGPAPRWVWIGGGVAVAVGFVYLRRGKSARPVDAGAVTSDVQGAPTPDVSGVIGTPAGAVSSVQGVGALPSQGTAAAAQVGGGQGARATATAPAARKTTAPARRGGTSQGSTARPAASSQRAQVQRAVHPVAVPEPVMGGVQQYDAPIGPGITAETRRGSRATRTNRGD